jgi:hypothetical protein
MYFLEPLIEHIPTSTPCTTWVPFPQRHRTPGSRDEYMPVEECGNILIMELALVNSLRYSDDQLWWSRWAAEGVNDTVKRGEFSLWDFNCGMASITSPQQTQQWVALPLAMTVMIKPNR